MIDETLEVDLSNLEMGKKRDKKVFITDEAIEKVPLVEYKEISDLYYEIIRDLNRQVLKMAKENNDSNETAITFSTDDMIDDEDRQSIGLAYGDEHSVNPIADTKSGHLITSSRECVVLLLHNHPSLSKISLQDVSFFLRYPSIKLLVAVTNLGSISYIVKNDKYDYVEAVKLYNKATDMYNDKNDLKGFKKRVISF